MAVTIVTGSAGLVGSTAVLRFAAHGDKVVGIDNDMRGQLFGESGSVGPNVEYLTERLGDGYIHESVDVRDDAAMNRIFQTYGADVETVIHAAAQPSHDWAARNPSTDFSINASGTLVLLEAMREHAEEASFVFLSTSKVYGDRPNKLPFVERSTRLDLPREHPLYSGIDEEFRVDQCVHSLFGASKLSADIFVQEYGWYFDLTTGVFRAGCVTGPRHAGVEQHGFLSHLVKTVVRGDNYTIFGHGGKQVRDNIHADDLVAAIEAFVSEPEPGEVFNIGGGRRCNCSLLEALSRVEDLTSKSASTTYRETPRKGDHRWYISDCSKFRSQYPSWTPQYDMEGILEELVEGAQPQDGSGDA